MSIVNLDLNAKNYTISELRNLLDINVPYTEEDIVESSDNIKNKILEDDTLTNEKKEEIMKFILKVENILKLDLNEFYIKLQNLSNNVDFISIPEIDNKPDTNEKFKSWPKGACVLYFNKELSKFQIYVKTSFVGENVEWSIFDSK
tara:strand:+ start:130 stop:567 length:438 start_codon:yes stop_codon:yes gene_type:complete